MSKRPFPAAAADTTAPDATTTSAAAASVPEAQPASASKRAKVEVSGTAATTTTTLQKQKQTGPSSYFLCTQCEHQLLNSFCNQTCDACGGRAKGVAIPFPEQGEVWIYTGTFRLRESCNGRCAYVLSKRQGSCGEKCNQAYFQVYGPIMKQSRASAEAALAAQLVEVLNAKFLEGRSFDHLVSLMGGDATLVVRSHRHYDCADLAPHLTLPQAMKAADALAQLRIFDINLQLQRVDQ